MVILSHTDATKNGVRPLRAKLSTKKHKNRAETYFLQVFKNNLSGNAPIKDFIASVWHNMTIAHPPTVERTLYDQN